MKDFIELSKSQILMGLVASCVESLAKRLHNDTATMYHCMDSVGMIDNYLIPFYDTLHTESRENLTDSLVETLERWEDKQLSIKL